MSGQESPVSDREKWPPSLSVSLDAKAGTPIGGDNVHVLCRYRWVTYLPWGVSVCQGLGVGIVGLWGSGEHLAEDTTQTLQ